MASQKLLLTVLVNGLLDRENKIQVGSIAKNAYPSYPDQTVLEINHLMGTE
jgi:hypothetical protein